MSHDQPAYGLWLLVLLNSAVFIMFAYSFFKPTTARDWRTFASTTFQLATDETGITVAPGVSIRTDPLGEISLISKTRLKVLGSLYAPAGKISLDLSPGNGVKFFYDVPSGRFNTLTIGPQAVISTAGVFLPSSGPRGLTPGQVLPRRHGDHPGHQK